MDNLKELMTDLGFENETNKDPMAKEQIYNTLKQFEDVEFPSQLHGRIMRTIYLRQFRTPLVIINTVLFANFGMSVYHLWHMLRPEWLKAQQMIASDVAAAERAAAHTPAWIQALQATPPETLAVVGINTALLAVGGYLLWKLFALLPGARAGSRGSQQ